MKIIKYLKMTSFFAFTMLLCMSFSSIVSADEMLKYKDDNTIKFINNNDVAISNSAYEKLKIYGYDDEEIMNLDESAYNKIETINIDRYDIVETYWKDTYIYSSIKDFEEQKKPSAVVTKKITKEEYDNSKSVTDLIYSNSAVHETASKKITLVIGYLSSTPRTKNVSIQTYWKSIPSVRSYDIMAMRIVNGEFNQNSQSITTNITMQTPTAACDGQYTTSTSTATAGYTSSGWNTRNITLGYYGIGFTSPLPSDTIYCYNDLGFPFYQSLKGYKTTIYVTATALGNANTVTIYGTYQHATSNVSFSNVAHTYDFNSSGLGNVVYFSNGMASYYAGTGYASLTY